MSLRTLLAELPDTATLPVSFVRQLFLELEAVSDGADLTVAQAGQILGRSPSSIRTWCASGALSAYRLRGREWRITRAALEEFQERERQTYATEGNGKAKTLGAGRRTGLGEWRKVRAGGK